MTMKEKAMAAAIQEHSNHNNASTRTNSKNF